MHVDALAGGVPGSACAPGAAQVLRTAGGWMGKRVPTRVSATTRMRTPRGG